jgi:hypothetical protein
MDDRNDTQTVTGMNVQETMHNCEEAGAMHEPAGMWQR